MNVSVPRSSLAHASPLLPALVSYVYNLRLGARCAPDALSRVQFTKHEAAAVLFPTGPTITSLHARKRHESERVGAHILIYPRAPERIIKGSLLKLALGPRGHGLCLSILTSPNTTTDSALRQLAACSYPISSHEREPRGYPNRSGGAR